MIIQLTKTQHKNADSFHLVIFKGSPSLLSFASCPPPLAAGTAVMAVVPLDVKYQRQVVGIVAVVLGGDTDARTPF